MDCLKCIHSIQNGGFVPQQPFVFCNAIYSLSLIFVFSLFKWEAGGWIFLCALFNALFTFSVCSRTHRLVTKMCSIKNKRNCFCYVFNLWYGSVTSSLFRQTGIELKSLLITKKSNFRECYKVINKKKTIYWNISIFQIQILIIPFSALMYISKNSYIKVFLFYENS